MNLDQDEGGKNINWKMAKWLVRETDTVQQTLRKSE